MKNWRANYNIIEQSFQRAGDLLAVFIERDFLATEHRYAVRVAADDTRLRSSLLDFEMREPLVRRLVRLEVVEDRFNAVRIGCFVLFEPKYRPTKVVHHRRNDEIRK